LGKRLEALIEKGDQKEQTVAPSMQLTSNLSRSIGLAFILIKNQP